MAAIVASVGTVVAAVPVLAVAASHSWRTGDTLALVGGLGRIDDCLRHARLVSCNARSGSIHGAPVTFFPLLQVFPAWLMHVLGLGDVRVVGGLGWLNVAATLALFAIVVRWAHARGGRRLAVLAGLFVVPGMLVAYLTQTFGEPLAALAFAGVVLAGLRRDRLSPWLAPAVLAATVSKETAVLLVLCFGMGAVLASSADRRTSRRAAITVLVAAVSGELLNVLFDIFRYGAWDNTFYLTYPRPGHGQVLDSAAALLVSPVGGAFWFWPAVAVAVVVVVLTALGRTPRGLERADRRRVQIGAALCLLGAVLAVGSDASWWDSMGWYAWGPRLILPSIPPVLVFALAMIGRQPARHRWLSPPAGALLAVVSIAVLAPTLNVTLKDGAGQSSQVYAMWAARPECHVGFAQGGFALFESCQRTEYWESTGWPLLENAPPHARAARHFDLSFGAAALAVVLWTAVGGGGRPRRPAPDEPAGPASPAPPVEVPDQREDDPAAVGS